MHESEIGVWPSFIEQINFHAANRQNHDAVVAGDTSYSYAEFLQLIESCSFILRQNNIKQDSVVGITIADEVST